MRGVERYLLLEIIDQRWQEHLYDMDYLQHGIGLRGLAQMDPLVAYKNEAFDLFRDLMNSVWSDFARLIYHVQVTDPRRQRPADGAPAAPPQRQLVLLVGDGGGRVTYSGGQNAAGAMAMAAAAGAAAGRGLRRGGRPPSPCSSGASTTPSRSGATTRAGAGRARSTRSATAPEPRHPA